MYRSKQEGVINEQTVPVVMDEVIETLKEYIFGNFEISRTVRHAIADAIDFIEQE